MAPKHHELFRLEVVALPKTLNIPDIVDIGEVVSAVLEECESSLRLFWRLVAGSAAPDREFRSAWEHVAEAFAKRAIGPSPEGRSSIGRLAEFAVHGANILIEAGEVAGFAWISDLLYEPRVRAARLGATAVVTFGNLATDSIRSAGVQLERERLKDDLAAAAAVRCLRVV